ncbi:MAG: replication initiation and membrane attachment family protein [Bacilli bacterium]
MVLPADSYIVVNKGVITEVDKKILVDLYQPIIGNSAVSLYLTLLNDLEKNSFVTGELTHHHLLSVMQISLEDIVKSREKLEGIGLLKTYVKKGSVNNYVYALYAPVSASEFLNHPILNMVLYNNVGKLEYKKIVDSYKLPRIVLKDYEDISLKFDEVFTSVPVNSFFNNDNIVSKKKGEILFKDIVDFELLISGLDTNIINEKAFNKDVRNLINNLSFLYNIDISTMQSLIRTCVNEKGMIDKDLLRKGARNFYQFENSGNLPTIVHYSQPEYLKSPVGDGSKRGKMIYTFENTNPYQFLKSKYKNGKVVARDLQIVENLLLDLKLSPGVVNVLLDYCLRVNNKKLNKNYIETIASHWKRLGIETVPEAMNACIKEHKKSSKKTASPVRKKQEEKVPEWFDQTIDKKKNEEEEKELANLINNYK